MNPRIEALEKMIGGPRDGALLRYSLGTEYLKAAAPGLAAESFGAAVERDPKYSAAWKMLAKALAEDGQTEKALATYERGIEVAQTQGDMQAAKEMTVFAKRLRKQLEGGAD